MCVDDCKCFELLGMGRANEDVVSARRVTSSGGSGDGECVTV